MLKGQTTDSPLDSMATAAVSVKSPALTGRTVTDPKIGTPVAGKAGGGPGTAVDGNSLGEVAASVEVPEKGGGQGGGYCSYGG